MYPIFLNLEHKKCLLVGGGKVAERKAQQLLDCGAEIYCVSLSYTLWFEQNADMGRITLYRRGYEKNEAAQYYLIIAATNDTLINRTISEDAKNADRLVNVVDDPENCSFYAGAVVKRGKLQIAISTSGAFPSLAKFLKRKLESQISLYYETLLERLEEFRLYSIKQIPDYASRQRTFEKVLSSQEVDDYLMGNREPLEKMLKECQ